MTVKKRNKKVLIVQLQSKKYFVTLKPGITEYYETAVLNSA